MIMFRPGEDSSALPGSLQPPAQVSLSQPVVNVQPDHSPVVPGSRLVLSYWSDLSRHCALIGCDQDVALL